MAKVHFDAATKYRSGLKEHFDASCSKAMDKRLPITERLAGGYQDACKVLGIQSVSLDQFAFLGKYAVGAFSVHKLEVFIEALNEGWEPDFDNDNERKYYSWWYLKASKGEPAGSGFSLRAVDCDRTTANVSARLVTKTEANARFAAKVMEAEYRLWLKKN